MNNSFSRLIDGMAEALKNEVLPHTDGEFARGQIFGVIYLLENLRIRAGWSVKFLGAQLDALDEYGESLSALPGLPDDAPRPPTGPRPIDAVAMEARRDEGDAAVCALIEWLQSSGCQASDEVRSEAFAAIDRYIHRQLKHEISTTARPRFSEISLGREINSNEVR